MTWMFVGLAEDRAGYDSAINALIDECREEADVRVRAPDSGSNRI